MQDPPEIDKGIIEHLEKFGFLHANRYSTLWERFIANIIDVIFLILFWTPAALAVMYSDIPLGILPSLEIVMGISPYIYVVLSHGMYGRTIGKKVMGLKVIDKSEQKEIGFRQAFLRDSVPIAGYCFVVILALAKFHQVYIPETSTLTHLEPIISFAWFILELLTAAFNYKRRAIHDYIAGTVVVKL